MPRVPGLSDLIDVLQAQTQALAALPGIFVSLNRSVQSFAGAATQARDTAMAVQRLTTRLNGMVDELDEPVRAMVPAMQRMAVALDNPFLGEVPDVLRRLQQEILPMLSTMRETQSKIAGIAAATDSIRGFVEDMGGRLTGLPAAAARLGWRWPG
jgi:ABC-type transporter Mla subunit MlaD